VPLVRPPQAVVERKDVERVALLGVLAKIERPDVEAREVSLVLSVIVKERRDESVRRGLALAVEVKRHHTEIDVRRGAGVARVAGCPRTERRTDQVEAAVLAVVQVRQ
jgi:hypothetical protein